MTRPERFGNFGWPYDNTNFWRPQRFLTHVPLALPLALSSNSPAKLGDFSFYLFSPFYRTIGKIPVFRYDYNLDCNRRGSFWKQTVCKRCNRRTITKNTLSYLLDPEKYIP